MTMITIAEDIIFILFFYSVFVLLKLLTPPFLVLLHIENDNIGQGVVWLFLGLISVLILKNIQQQRNEKEIEEIENIISDKNTKK